MKVFISVRRLRSRIAALPSDRPRINPGVWFRTQKEHWLGWLAEYHGPGAYGRVGGVGRDAGFAYNHIVNPYMLVWLVRAAGFPASVVREVRNAGDGAGTYQARSAAIRKIVPWERIAPILWPRLEQFRDERIVE